MKIIAVLIIAATLLGCSGFEIYSQSSLAHGDKYTFYVYRPIGRNTAIEIDNLLLPVLDENEYIFTVYIVDDYIEVQTTIGPPVYGKPGQHGNIYRMQKVEGHYKLVYGPSMWIS